MSKKDINAMKTLLDSCTVFVEHEENESDLDFELPAIKVKGGFLIVTSTPTHSNITKFIKRG